MDKDLMNETRKGEEIRREKKEGRKEKEKKKKMGNNL
jgi:hypothetical protein